MRNVLLLALLVGLLVALTSCGADDARQSTAATQPSPAARASLPEDASPEQVRQAVIAALRGLGPVRIDSENRTEGAGDDGMPPRTALQLVDSANHLAKGTSSFGGVVGEQWSVVGNRRLSISTGEGSEPRITEHFALADDRPRPALEGLSSSFLEEAEAAGATRSSDGSWELRFKGQSGGGSGETVLLVGPDLLPREVKREGEGQRGSGVAGPDGIVEQTEESYTFIVRTTYRFQTIPPLTEEDVKLPIPKGVRINERSSELAPDNPQADVEGLQYWLGQEVAGMPVAGAVLRVLEPDTAQEKKSVFIHYRKKGSGELAFIEFIQMQPGSMRGAELTEGYEGRATVEEKSIAGRKAAVYTLEPETGQLEIPAFALLIEFPDLTLFIEAVGLKPDGVGAVLEAIQEL